LFWELHAASIILFIPTNVTPQKKEMGDFFVKVFSREIEELRQESFKNGENHKLGDVKTLLDYTLSVCTHLLFFSINAVLSHKLGASFIVLL
jgi:hypothetical protein